MEARFTEEQILEYEAISLRHLQEIEQGLNYLVGRLQVEPLPEVRKDLETMQISSYIWNSLREYYRGPESDILAVLDQVRQQIQRSNWDSFRECESCRAMPDPYKNSREALALLHKYGNQGMERKGYSVLGFLLAGRNILEEFLDLLRTGCCVQGSCSHAGSRRKYDNKPINPRELLPKNVSGCAWQSYTIRNWMIDKLTNRLR